MVFSLEDGIKPTKKQINFIAEIEDACGDGYE